MEQQQLNRLLAVIKQITPQEMRAIWDVTGRLIQEANTALDTADEFNKTRQAFALEGLREKIAVIRELVTEQFLQFPTHDESVIIHSDTPKGT